MTHPNDDFESTLNGLQQRIEKRNALLAELSGLQIKEFKEFLEANQDFELFDLDRDTIIQWLKDARSIQQLYLHLYGEVGTINAEMRSTVDGLEAMFETLSSDAQFINDLRTAAESLDDLRGDVSSTKLASLKSTLQRLQTRLQIDKQVKHETYRNVDAEKRLYQALKTANYSQFESVYTQSEMQSNDKWRNLHDEWKEFRNLIARAKKIDLHSKLKPTDNFVQIFDRLWHTGMRVDNDIFNAELENWRNAYSRLAEHAENTTELSVNTLKTFATRISNAQARQQSQDKNPTFILLQAISQSQSSGGRTPLAAAVAALVIAFIALVLPFVTDNTPSVDAIVAQVRAESGVSVAEATLEATAEMTEPVSLSTAELTPDMTPEITADVTDEVTDNNAEATSATDNATGEETTATDENTIADNATPEDTTEPDENSVTEDNSEDSDSEELPSTTAEATPTTSVALPPLEIEDVSAEQADDDFLQWTFTVDASVSDDATYEWNFGTDSSQNSSGTDSESSHRYTQPGYYQASVTVNDGTERTQTATVDVLILDITQQPNEENPQQVDVSLTNITPADGLDITWEIDGTPQPDAAGQPQTTFTFQEPRTYEITVSVTPPDGKTVTQPITVEAVAPEPELALSVEEITKETDWHYFNYDPAGNILRFFMCNDTDECPAIPIFSLGESNLQGVDPLTLLDYRESEVTLQVNDDKTHILLIPLQEHENVDGYFSTEIIANEQTYTIEYIAVSNVQIRTTAEVEGVEGIENRERIEIAEDEGNVYGLQFPTTDTTTAVLTYEAIYEEGFDVPNYPITLKINSHPNQETNLIVNESQENFNPGRTGVTEIPTKTGLDGKLTVRLTLNPARPGSDGDSVDSVDSVLSNLLVTFDAEPEVQTDHWVRLQPFNVVDATVADVPGTLIRPQTNANGIFFSSGSPELLPRLEDIVLYIRNTPGGNREFAGRMVVWLPGDATTSVEGGELEMNNEEPIYYCHRISCIPTDDAASVTAEGMGYVSNVAPDDTTLAETTPILPASISTEDRSVTFIGEVTINETRYILAELAVVFNSN